MCGPTGGAPSETADFKQSNVQDSPPSPSRHLREYGLPMGRVVCRLCREHGHEHCEKTINDATQCPAVAVPASAEELVMLAAMRVVLHADEAPVVERVPEARIAGVAHADEETFAALPRDRRDAGLGAQTVIISGRQEPRGLGKHRGGGDSPDAWQGPGTAAGHERCPDQAGFCGGALLPRLWSRTAWVP